MALNIIDLIFKVKSDVDKEMKKGKEAVKDLEKQTVKSAKKMASKFDNVKTAIQAALGVAALKAGADLIKSSEKMGLALAILKVKNEDVYAQLLKTEEATFGLANKFDMVTAANKALAFGIDLSDGKLQGLMRISTKLAAVMGIEVKQAFDDLIVSSARQQKLIADNLGIMVDKVKVDQAYADQLGITKDKLTEQQQSQAFLNEILKKGSIITKELSNDFIKARTEGTAALKEIETAATSALNASAKAFVTFGKALGTTAAMGDEFFENWVTGFKDIAGITKEAEGEYKAYVKRLKDLDENRSAAYQNIQKQYLGTTKKTVIQSYDVWFNYHKARQQLEEESLKIDADIEKKRQDMLKELALDEADVPAAAELIIASNKKMNALVEAATKPLRDKKAAKKIKEDRKNAEKAARIALGIKKDLIKDIIQFEEDEIKIDELNNVERLNAKIKLAAMEKQLLIKSEKELKGLRLTLAREADTALMAQKNKEVIEKLELAVFSSEETKYQARLDWNEQTNKMLADYAKKEADIEKQREAETEKHFNTLKSYGNEYLQAVLTGNIEMIPQILAQQAMRFGTEMIWDGTKAVWQGIVMNATVPGSGAALMTAGAGEIAAGGIIAAAGGVANSQLSSTPTGSESGSRERNDASSRQQTINMNVQTSLYGSKTQAKREINDIMR